MQRTQIMITDEQMELLRNEAYKRRVSIAELVRESIDKQFKPQPATNTHNTNVGQALLDIAHESKQLKRSGPPDLSSNVDSYMYGNNE